MTGELIFVYNAKGDLFGAVTEFAHKIISPSTYDCKLCALTYGNFTMKQEWKTFIEHLPISSSFIYRNVFPGNYDLPAVFISASGSMKQIISKQEIESCASLQALKELVTERLKPYVQHHHPDIP